MQTNYWYSQCVLSIFLLYNERLHFEKFNPGFLGFCGSPSYNPGHCIGYDDGEVPDGFTIPCGRGTSDIGRIWYRSLLAWVGIAPLIIIGTSLTLVYKSVLKNEEKMSRYGRGSLRIKYDVTQNNKKEPSKEEPQVGFWMRKMSKRKPESTLTANAVACSQMKKATRLVPCEFWPQIHKKFTHLLMIFKFF